MLNPDYSHNWLSYAGGIFPKVCAEKHPVWYVSSLGLVLCVCILSPQPLTFKHHLQRATRNGSCAGQSRVLGHLGTIMSAVRVYFRRPCAFILLGICLTRSFADNCDCNSLCRLVSVLCEEATSPGFRTFAGVDLCLRGGVSLCPADGGCATTSAGTSNLSCCCCLWGVLRV